MYKVKPNFTQRTLSTSNHISASVTCASFLPAAVFKVNLMQDLQFYFSQMTVRQIVEVVHEPICEYTRQANPVAIAIKISEQYILVSLLPQPASLSESRCRMTNQPCNWA